VQRRKSIDIGCDCTEGVGIYMSGGNGGMKPRHGDIATDLDDETL